MEYEKYLFIYLLIINKNQKGKEREEKKYGEDEI